MIARQETVICPECGAEVLERPETSKLKRLSYSRIGFSHCCYHGGGDDPLTGPNLPRETPSARRRASKRAIRLRAVAQAGGHEADSYDDDLMVIELNCQIISTQKS